MKKMTMYLAAIILVSLSLVGPFGISLVGPANSSIEASEVKSTHRHTLETCIVFLDSPKESYCKVIEIR